MTLKIEQGYEYQGTDWWKWWVWIDGQDAELDKISHVIYTLRPTFPEPVQTVGNRRTKFRLTTAGWGVFRLYAKVVHEDGKETHLEHDLELEYPQP